MANWREKLERILDFFRSGIWEVEGEGLSRGRRFLLDKGQIAYLVIREFVADRCILRASALTYTTLLAIVPLFALTFSVLTGLGVQNTLAPIILERITVGSEQIVHEIVGYINNTNVGRLGVVGLVTLILTVLTLLSNVEASFNAVWGTAETRPLFRRFADFTSVLLLGPVFLFAAISMTSTLENQSFVQSLIDQRVVGEVILFLFRVLPYVAMWAAFVFLYVFMPNVKVQFQAALIGGIFGGTLWQLAQWGYVTFQVGVSRYNAIYGTMAALPILMVWIYLSWLIVLIGAEVAYVWQNLGTIRREMRAEKINFLSQEMVALAVLMRVTAHFYKGERPRSLARIAEELHLPPRLARIVVNELVQLHFLSEVKDGNEDDLLQPARPPEQVRVLEVLQAFRGSGTTLGTQERITEWKAARRLEEQLADAQEHVLDGMTLKDLAVKEGEGKVKGER